MLQVSEAWLPVPVSRENRSLNGEFSRQLPTVVPSMTDEGDVIKDASSYLLCYFCVSC
jgi:hypothetical protein